MVDISAATLFETIVIVSTRIVPFADRIRSECVERTGEADKNKVEGGGRVHVLHTLSQVEKEYSTVQCSVG